MNPITISKVAKATLTLAILTVNLLPVASAQQDLTAELQQMAIECRAAGSECFHTCTLASRNLARGREVSDADIEACRNTYAKLEPQAPPEMAWTPEYAPMPDVVGVFRGVLVAAQGRDDWKRYCRSSALVGDINAPAPWDIPKGATVRVSGVRYVTNPIRSLDRSKTACRAESVEVLSIP